MVKKGIADRIGRSEVGAMHGDGAVVCRRCAYCGQRFQPDRRVRRVQKACPRKKCRLARKREANRKWARVNADAGRARKLREWAKRYPNYWQCWRAAHPEYRKRERRRRLARRRRVANQTKWRSPGRSG